MSSGSKVLLKQGLLAQISAYLDRELTAARQASQAAYDAATNSESKAENKYDTRGLEASYLAGAQKERENVLEAGLVLLRGLRIEALDEDTPVKLLTVVEVEQAGECSRYFIAPLGGGYKLDHGEEKISVLTPQSPLGQRLLGKRVGDVVSIRAAHGTKEYEVLAVW